MRKSIYLGSGAPGGGHSGHVHMNEPSVIEEGPLRFVVFDAPSPKNLHAYIASLKKPVHFSRSIVHKLAQACPYPHSSFRSDLSAFCW